MDSLKAKFGNKKKKGLLSDPSASPPRSPHGDDDSLANLPAFNALLLSSPLASPGTSPQPISSSATAASSRKSTTAPPTATSSRQSSTVRVSNNAYYEPSDYTVVGADGAIGAHDWSADEEVSDDSLNDRSSSRTTTTSGVRVPTLGQIDQLTEEQERAITATQHQQLQQQQHHQSSLLSQQLQSSQLQSQSQSMVTGASNQAPLEATHSSSSASIATSSSSSSTTAASTSTDVPTAIITNPTITVDDEFEAFEGASSVASSSTSGVFGIAAALQSLPRKRSFDTTPLLTAASTSPAALVAGSRSASGVLSVVAHASTPTSLPPSRRGSSSINQSATTIPTGGGVASESSISNPSTPSLRSNILGAPSASVPPFHIDPPSGGGLMISSTAASASTTGSGLVRSNSVIGRTMSGAFAYPRIPNSRPSISGPQSNMMNIGRAAAAEVRSLVSEPRLTVDGGTSPIQRESSPSYVTYQQIVQENAVASTTATATATSKYSTGIDSPPMMPVSSSTSPSLAAVPPIIPPSSHLSIPSSTSPPSSSSTPSHGHTHAPGHTRTHSGGGGGGSGTILPPRLPPRTHIRQRYTSTRYGSRRSNSGTVMSNSMTREEADAAAQMQRERTVPIDLEVHLLMSTYLLLYFALHLVLPSILALLLPILVYFGILHGLEPLDSYLTRRYPSIHLLETLSPSPPPPTLDAAAYSQSLETILAEAEQEPLRDEVVFYHAPHTLPSKSRL